MITIKIPHIMFWPFMIYYISASWQRALIGWNLLMSDIAGLFS